MRRTFLNRIIMLGWIGCSSEKRKKYKRRHETLINVITRKVNWTILWWTYVWNNTSHFFIFEKNSYFLIPEEKSKSRREYSKENLIFFWNSLLCVPEKENLYVNFSLLSLYRFLRSFLLSENLPSERNVFLYVGIFSNKFHFRYRKVQSQSVLSFVLTCNELY